MSFILTRDLTSYRHDEPGPDIPAMFDQTDRLIRLRDEAPIDSEEFAEAVHTILDFQREDGSFSYLSSYEIPSDARVDFVYHPTYICCQILIKAMLSGNPNKNIVPALQRGLEFSCSRRLMGHGIDGLRDQMRTIQDFIDSDIMTILDYQPTLCPEFTAMLIEIAEEYAKMIEDCDTILPYEDDATIKMMRIVETLNDPVSVPVFVYGTLMSGEANHYLVEDCEYLGPADIFGFALHDLGAYPAVKYTERPSTVTGELVTCDADTLEQLDILEQLGNLYNRAVTNVFMDNGSVRKAYVYVYRNEVTDDSRVPVELQPWPYLKDLQRTHVWYVAYGSNLLRERFMCYIEGGFCEDNGRAYDGCRDKTAPLCDIPVTIPYNVYFGNRSASWGNSGVAFLDTSRKGLALGRAYLVTKEQLADIHEQEGNGANWYRSKQLIGKLAGIPMIAFTNNHEREHVMPSEAYLDVMRRGLTEGAGALTDELAEEYLQQAVER